MGSFDSFYCILNNADNAPYIKSGLQEVLVFSAASVYSEKCNFECVFTTRVHTYLWENLMLFKKLKREML